MAVSNTILSAVFSDESSYYRFPSEPDSGDTVRIRLRVAKDSAERVILLFESLTVGTMMFKVKTDDFFDYYEAKGWLVGKGKMKDWKAVIRNWERKDPAGLPRPSASPRRPRAQPARSRKSISARLLPKVLPELHQAQSACFPSELAYQKSQKKFGSVFQHRNPKKHL